MMICVAFNARYTLRSWSLVRVALIVVCFMGASAQAVEMTTLSQLQLTRSAQGGATDFGLRQPRDHGGFSSAERRSTPYPITAGND